MSVYFIVKSSSGGPVVPVVVQTVKHTWNNGVNTLSVAYNSNVTAGNTLIAAVGYNNASVGLTSVKDTLNGSVNWTSAGVLEQNFGYTTAIYFFTPTIAGATTVTVLVSGNPNGFDLAIIEVSGLNGWIDTYAIGTASSGNPTFGPLSTVGANDFILSFKAGANSATAGSSGWTFTQLSSTLYGFQYIVGSTAGSFDPSFTSASGGWAASAVALIAGPVPSIYPVIVQGLKGATSGPAVTTVSASYTSALSAGSTLVAVVGWANTTSTVTSVKDNLNNVNWTLAGTFEQGNGLSAAVYYYSYTKAGSATVTLTISASSTNLSLGFYEVANISGGIDVFSAATGVSSTAPTPGILTTTAGYDFLIAFVATSGTSTAGSQAWIYNTFGTTNYGAQYRIGPATGAYNPVFTTTSGNYSAVAVAFKPGYDPRNPHLTETQKAAISAFAISSFNYVMDTNAQSITEGVGNYAQISNFAISSFNYVQTVNVQSITESSKAQISTFAISSFNYA